jgi:hypothetical protein
MPSLIHRLSDDWKDELVQICKGVIHSTDGDIKEDVLSLDGEDTSFFANMAWETGIADDEKLQRACITIRPAAEYADFYELTRSSYGERIVSTDMLRDTEFLNDFQIMKESANSLWEMAKEEIANRENCPDAKYICISETTRSILLIFRNCYSVVRCSGCMNADWEMIDAVKDWNEVGMKYINMFTNLKLHANMWMYNIEDPYTVYSNFDAGGERRLWDVYKGSEDVHNSMIALFMGQHGRLGLESASKHLLTDEGVGGIIRHHVLHSSQHNGDEICKMLLDAARREAYSQKKNGNTKKSIKKRNSKRRKVPMACCIACNKLFIL